MDLRNGLIDLIEAAGISVAAAGDGLHAVDLVREGFHPSLILLDLMMPMMNGEHFLLVKTSIPEIASVPVIVLTGKEEFASRDETVKAVLKKPIDPDRLLALIRTLAGLT